MRLRHVPILLGIAFLLPVTVTTASWDPASIPFKNAQFPKHPWIALTFDDGPHAGWTENLLKVLRQEHVPVTFFVVGKMADRYPELIREMAQDGHEIANHTYTHPRLSRLEGPEVLTELDETRATIKRLTGRDSILFRPPGGDYTRRTVRVTSKAGYKMVLWSVLTNDVVGASKPIIWRRIRQGADDGGIILMHSGVQRTIDMLPEIVADLRLRGYHFVTVSTLMNLPSAAYYLPPFDPIFNPESNTPKPTTTLAKASVP